MPLRSANPFAYHRTAASRPLSSRNGGCSRYDNVRAVDQIDAFGEQRAISVRHHHRAAQPAEEHLDRGEILRRRLVQHPRDSPPLVVLGAHEARGQRAQVGQRFLKLRFGPLAVFDIGRHAIPFDDSSRFIVQRSGPNQKLTIGPVGPPQAHFIVVRFITRICARQRSRTRGVSSG
jgi:hypothetical protein